MLRKTNEVRKASMAKRGIAGSRQVTNAGSAAVIQSPAHTGVFRFAGPGGIKVTIVDKAKLNQRTRGASGQKGHGKQPA